MNQSSDNITVFLFMGAIAVVCFRRTIATWLGWGLLVLLVLVAVYGNK